MSSPLSSPPSSPGPKPEKAALVVVTHDAKMEGETELLGDSLTGKEEGAHKGVEASGGEKEGEGLRSQEAEGFWSAKGVTPKGYCSTNEVRKKRCRKTKGARMKGYRMQEHLTGSRR